MNECLVITALGELTFRLNCEPIARFSSRKAEALLVYLAVEGEMIHRRESLFTLLWPGMPESSARRNLNQVLYSLRQTIPTVPTTVIGSEPVPLFLSDRKTVQINPTAALNVDIHRLDNLFMRVKDHSHENLATCNRCWLALEEVNEINQGAFLLGFYLPDSNQFEEWAQVTREKYRQKKLETLNTLVAICVHKKDYVQASDYVEAQLAIDNLQESAHHQMMKLLVLLGRRVEAIRQYHKCARILKAELGISPSKETTQFFERIQTEDHFIPIPKLETQISEVPAGLDTSLVENSSICHPNSATIVETLSSDSQIEMTLIKGVYGDEPVFRKYDPILGCEISIHFISSVGWDDDGLRTFLHEVKAISRLNHPNILKILSAGLVDLTEIPGFNLIPHRSKTVPFIVMEADNGVSFRKMQPGSFEETIDIIRQICTALEHAHDNGIVHGSVKPENIIISSNGTVRLKAFGLNHLSEPITTNGDTGSEISAYIAPEQALGQKIDFRTDLYLLGLVLYEKTTTGECPFKADDPITLISQILNTPLIPPKVKNAEIPWGLANLITRLLRKDPAERPASTKEVRQFLENPRLLLATEDYIEEHNLLDRIIRGQIVGRDAELQSTRKFWNKARNGDGQTLLISGEPGIGKTRLMREVVAQVVATGGTALVGSCYPVGNNPYQAFLQIIRRAFRRYPDLGDDLPGFVMAELIKIVPGLQVLYPDILENSRLEPQAQVQRLLESLVAFSKAMSDRIPLLIVVEDLHWSDRGTLSIFQILARRTSRLRVMVLGTYREVDLDDDHPFNQVLIDLNRERLATGLKLTRLDQEKTGKMLTVLLAEEPPHEFLDGIFMETEGNPFFIEEVCRALIENGKLYLDDGKWQGCSTAALEIPQSVRTVIQSRVGKLPQVVQEIITLAAIIGQEFDFDTLQAASYLDEDTIVNALDIAERAQMIEEIRSEAGGTFIFSHTLIPTTLGCGLSGLRRRRYHRQTAQAIEEIHPSSYQRLAYHWREASDEEKEIAYTLKAAQQARRTYANGDAINLYTRALELLPDDHIKCFEIVAERASIFQMTANRDAQFLDIEAMGSIAERLDDDRFRCESILALAAYYHRSEYEKTFKLLTQVIEIAKSLHDPILRAKALMLMGIIFRDTFNYVASLEALETAAKLFQESGLISKSIQCLNALSKAYFVSADYEATWDTTERVLKLSRETNDRQQETIALQRLSSLHLSQGDPIKALSYDKQALSIARKIGDKDAEMAALNNLGVYFSTVDKEESKDNFVQSIQIAESLGSRSTAVGNYFFDHIVPPGEYASGLTFLQNGLERAESLGNDALAVNYQLNIHECLFDLGQYHQLIDSIDRNLNLIERFSGPLEMLSAKSLKGLAQFLSGDHETGMGLMGASCDQLESTLASVHYSKALIRLAFANSIREVPRIWADSLVLINQAVPPFIDSVVWQGVKASYFHIAARLYLRLGNIEQALSASAVPIKIVEQFIGYQWQELYYWTHCQILRAANLVEDSDLYLGKALQRVISVADNIHDESLRQSWLENVPYNREILKEAKERGITED